MKRYMSRIAVTTASIALVIGSSLVASSATQAADGTLTFLPKSGTGADSFSVVTSGGCQSSSAEYFQIKMTGGGLQEENNLSGVQPLSAISAIPTENEPITAPVSKLFDTVAAENDGLPNGVYTVTFICRAKLSVAPIKSFAAEVTIKNSAGKIEWSEGATPEPEQLIASTKPKIGVQGGGKAKVGSTLAVTNGTWNVSPDSYKYAWKLGKKTVGKKQTLKVSKNYKGKTLKVTVTATKAGYKAGKATASIKIAKK